MRREPGPIVSEIHTSLRPRAFAPKVQGVRCKSSTTGRTSIRFRHLRPLGRRVRRRHRSLLPHHGRARRKCAPTTRHSARASPTSRHGFAKEVRSQSTLSPVRPPAFLPLPQALEPRKLARQKPALARAARLSSWAMSFAHLTTRAATPGMHQRRAPSRTRSRAGHGLRPVSNRSLFSIHPTRSRRRRGNVEPLDRGSHRQRRKWDRRRRGLQ